MKKSILIAMGILYSSVGLSYAYYDSPIFIAPDWNKVTSRFTSSEPNLLECGMQDTYYTCWTKSPSFDNPIPPSIQGLISFF